MKSFTEPLGQLKEFPQIQSDIRLNNVPVHIDGCMETQKCHFIKALSDQYQYKVIVTYNDVKAKELYEDCKFFFKDVYLYPAKDILFFSADIHGNLIVKQRLNVIRRLIEGLPTTIITTIDGLADHILPLELLKKHIITIKEGDIIPLKSLITDMINIGYERVGQVEESGQFSVRGGIIDFYNMSDDCPYRIELWDNEIDSIRSFDVESQRSIERCDSIKIYPASEFVFTEEVIQNGIQNIEEDMQKQVAVFEKGGFIAAADLCRQIVGELKENLKHSFGQTNVDGYIRYFYNETMSFADYFDNSESIVFIDEPARIEEKIQVVETEFSESMIGRLEKGYILPEQIESRYSFRDIVHRLNKQRTILFSTLAQKVKHFDIKSKYYITIKTINPYNSNFEILVKDLKYWKKSKYKIILVSSSRSRAERLVKDLVEYNLNAFYTEDLDRVVKSGEIMIVHGKLRHGIEYPLIKFAMIAEGDIFGAEKRRKAKKPKYDGTKITSFLDLNIGDYIVHENHGLGIYKGIEKIEVDTVAKDYIKIEYSNGGNLYILASQLDLIQKYAGADSRKPKLNKLGGQEWTRTKTRVRKAVKELAVDLIQLYADRQSREGYQFSEDNLWQGEFEETFPYEETEDQLVAIESTKRDMESNKIMDRLVCGDVGYGKTEIAIRAAFKAVQDGKQVVLLVPTTILAQQHYNTFCQRMKDYPIEIDLLCRFRTRSEQLKTIMRLKKGLVDIVIGTHRVLSKDVSFKDLGLLVVDEEQRFGVTHKEKIKRLKGDVDVLTLTATPIPRTLHMSLIGIRDMSVLEEPPGERMPIQTYIMEYSEEMVREAINRELAREGQVYYVYNRVNTIQEMAATLSKIVPEAEVAFAHGQMGERDLENIMYRFIHGEIDVLVSTTIIETGLDISNVNTMIIHDADKLGLSQLYQLRGRIGRTNKMAYAFLMYRQNVILREVAEKRLSAIREFTELGSGFKIAMRDLEIRGAGNLLGEQQSGHMEAVGYDLYCKMLGEAVREQKGDTIEEAFETTIDLDIDAYIPADYIKSELQKLEIYKRIAAIANEEEYEEMTDELVDRYGDLPKPAKNLLAIALLKAMAHEAGIAQIVHKDMVTKVVMYNRAKVDILRLPKLLEKYHDTMKFNAGENPYFIIKLKKNPNMDIIKCEQCVINDIKTLIDS